jgi:hypothetical protein
LFIFAGRADGDLPIQSKAAERQQSAGVGASPSRAGDKLLSRIIKGLESPIAVGNSAMTERIREFLRKRKDEGPCLVVDLDVVRDNYTAFAKALPDTRVFYAVKANPAPEVLALLAKLGSCFDTASIAEIEMVLAAGANARPHLLWQHDQEGARYRARLCARRSSLCRRLQGRGREDRPGSTWQPRVLPYPV